MIVVAAIIWFGVLRETAGKPLPTQPVGKSTDWAVEPTGPAVHVNLPTTRMTNVPNKAP